MYTKQNSDESNTGAKDSNPIPNPLKLTLKSNLET